MENLGSRPLSDDEHHPVEGTPRDLLRTFSLGMVTGLRSMMPFAVLSGYLEREGPDIADGGWPIDVLASPWGATVLALAAAGELVADKLPLLPGRVEPLPLVARVVMGGTVGAAASLAEGRTSDSGALLGSVGGLVGSVLGYTLRMRLSRRLPGLLVALAEDAVAFSLARWAVTH